MTTTNRLAQEKSPYLLQHAHNPVDWYPWGEAAFERARRDNKPIFLSVGYSTCHWCHVMERESFEDESIAHLLNRHFIAIKVDREERPDIDHVYMTFVQATTGSGGWPMSVFLTPTLAPFFGGTYFPPEARWGSPGFRQLLAGIASEWEEDPIRITTSAGRVLEALRTMALSASSGPLDPGVLRLCYQYFLDAFDDVHGGFEGAPKFPRPVVFYFLLRYYLKSGQQKALDITVDTLQHMARGGIHDHLGGGFHRYSVDAAWHVPHFEKMLYDQAQLVRAYAEAYQLTRIPELADVVRDIIAYLVRDMKAPEGAFYSAEDADSVIDPQHPADKGEGAFYIWDDSEIHPLLEPPADMLFAQHYDVRTEGNVLSDPHGEFVNKNILHIVSEVEELSTASGLTVDKVKTQLSLARDILLEHRNRRPRPSLDDKILASWNGMIIGALAKSSEILGDESYLSLAVDAANFLWDTMRNPDTGELYRRYRQGDAGIEGLHDDYANTVESFIDLYEATLDIVWLIRAVDLQEKQDGLFWSDEEGAYFDTTGRDESVLLRARSDYDGAEPSPNSVSALNLVRLAALTGRDTFHQQAEKIVATLGGRTPAAIPNLLVAADFLLSRPVHMVIAGQPGAADTNQLLTAIRRHFLPHRVLMLVDGGVAQERLSHWHPYLAAVQPVQGKATVYLCENNACRQPMVDPEEVDRVLHALALPKTPTN